jgi:hypothetical protein
MDAVVGLIFSSFFLQARKDSAKKTIKYLDISMFKSPIFKELTRKKGLLKGTTDFLNYLKFRCFGF